MRPLWLLTLVPVLSAQLVPGKYIVELTGSPAPSVRARTPVLAEQSRLRPAIESLGAKVVASVDLVANALIVEIPDALAPRLARHPGIRRVTPVPLMHMSLDHALPLLNVPAAWAAIGGIANAGAGVKIGIIDSGINTTHPAFQDDSLSIPPGFPVAPNFIDATNTNNKIIVARTYVPGSSVIDQLGHGTAVAMAAAGRTNTGPLATISGVAPKAWLGIYKVDDRPTFDSSLLLRALDDAVADGMDVINISAGFIGTDRVEFDPYVAAVERASALGAVVVLVAGNEGPGSTTINSPSSAPSAIAVGASANDRMFASASVLVDDAPGYVAQSANGQRPENAITAPLADVATLDTTGEACAALPPNSLTGRIALILRSPRSGPSCTFEDKLNHAQQAGAVAGIVYMNSDSPEIVTMDVLRATLPAVSIDSDAGLDIRNRIRAASPSGTIQFTLSQVTRNGRAMASFSSRGPNLDLAIKPDIVATGDNLYLATERVNAFGILYDPSGYLTNGQGTSFSSPLVAGAVALLKGARPGLTAAQYRSLLVNNAAALSAPDGSALPLQSTGAGLLDAAAALRGTIAVNPVSVSFGATTGAATLTRPIQITNLAPFEDTLSISATSLSGVALALPAGSIRLASGATTTVNLRLLIPDPVVGISQGYVRLRGSRAESDTVVPYWYAFTDQTPAEIPLLSIPDGGFAGSLQRISFRVVDRSGVPIASLAPTVKVIGGSGSVQSVTGNDLSYAATVRLGQGGANIYEIGAGAVSVRVIIQTE